MSENIFADEWIDCLEAHYVHVIRTKDRVTEPSLTIVMRSAGFNDKQLAELRVRATMHVDDVGADFVPDLNVLDGHGHSHTHNDAQVHTHEPAHTEAIEPQIFNIPIDLPPAADELQLEALPIDETVPEAELEFEIDTPELELEAAVDLLPPELEVETDIPEAELEVIADLPEVELEVDAEVETEALTEDEPEEPDPDAPQQLSLF